MQIVIDKHDLSRKIMMVALIIYNCVKESVINFEIYLLLSESNSLIEWQLEELSLTRA